MPMSLPGLRLTWLPGVSQRKKLTRSGYRLGGLKEQVQQLVKKSERANSEIERDAASEASRSFGV